MSFNVVQGSVFGMDLHRFVLLIPSLFIVTLLGCASRDWQASRLYNEGLYAESAEAYENMLKADPSNSAAKSGLENARTALWKKELAALREKRASGNGEGAMNSLEALLEKRKAWEQSSSLPAHLDPVDQDVQSARKVLEALIREKLSENKALVASQLWEKYDLLRDEKSFGSFNPKLEEEIQNDGKSLCDRLRTYLGEMSFSFSEIYSAVCSYYEIEPYKVSLDKNLDYRFSKVNLKNQVNIQIPGTTSAAQSKAMRQKLEMRLKNAGLISSRSQKVLSVLWVGTAFRKHTSEQQMMAHFYRETMGNEDSGPAKGDEMQHNGNASSPSSSREQRSFRYEATAHKESLNVNFSLSAKTTSEVRASHTNEESKEFVSHTANRPEIGLRPVPPDFLPALAWLDLQLEKGADGFVDAVVDSLYNRMCRSALNIDVSPRAIENLSRCAQLKPNDPEVSEWFLNNFGLSREQILETVKKK
ncbi:MAG: hypothetical protein RIR26_1399 [Pseudomonadota bacterium]|jgi:curved DNA-binding protein CbpA